MAKEKSTRELLDHLRALLREAFLLRKHGAVYAKIARAHGYADGYMRMLTESGLADTRTLLALVAEVRESVDGPATQVASWSDAEETRTEFVFSS